MSNKTCKKCGEEKPLTAFYIHKSMSDGRLNFCKACVRKRVTTHRANNLERVREYDRNRTDQPQRIAARQIITKRWNTDPELKRLAGERKRANNKNSPEKVKARNALNNAVRDGKVIPKACERCNATEFVHAHHDDYLKPLEVMWLCKTCHGKRHREINNERRTQQQAAQ